MRLILHLGIHRTGSTSIQRFLDKNRKELMDRGYLYPLIDGQDSHSRVPHQLDSSLITPRDLDDAIKKQSDGKTHTVIISAEDFARLKKMDFLEYFDNCYQLNVVIYLRRQDLWLESWYNQHVKWPWDTRFSGADMQSFLKDLNEFHWIDYQKLLERVEKHITRGTIYLKILDEYGIKDSCLDFISHAGMDIRPGQQEKSENTSFSSAKIDVLRRINIIELSDAGKWRIIKTLRKLEIEEDDGTHYFLAPEERTRICNLYSESNSSIAQRYFQRNSLFSEYPGHGCEPCLVSDDQAYGRYIPKLLKMLAEEQ